MQSPGSFSTILLAFAALAVPNFAQSTPTPGELFEFARFWTQTDVETGSGPQDFKPPDLICLLGGRCSVGPRTVWFIDNARPTNGDGTLANPFNSFEPVNGAGGMGDVDGPEDVLFVFEGDSPYLVSLSLEEGQHLVGQGVDLVVGGDTLVLGSPEQMPTLSNQGINDPAVELGERGEVRGIRTEVYGSSGVSALGISNAVIESVTVDSITGDPAGLVIRNMPGGTVDIRNVSVSGGGRGIDLNNDDGLIRIVDCTVRITSDPCIQVRSGTGEVQIAGATLLSNTTSSLLSVTNGNAGKLTAEASVRMNGISISFSNADGDYTIQGPVRLMGRTPRVRVFSASDGTVQLDDVEVEPSPTTLNLFPSPLLEITGGAAEVQVNGGFFRTQHNYPIARIGGGHTGTVTVAAAVSIFASSGTGMIFEEASGRYDFLGPISLAEGDAGVDVVDSVSATILFVDLSVTNPSGSCLEVAGGSAEIDWRGGLIAQSNPSPAIKVHQGHTGRIHVAELVAVTTTNSRGLQFDAADGEYRFLGPLEMVGGDAGIDILGSEGRFTFRDATVNNTAGGEGVLIDGTVVTLLNESFDSPVLPRGWSLEGFRIPGSATMNQPNLWHSSNVRSEDGLPNHTPDFAAYYGKNETTQVGGDYDTPGERNGGSLRTAEFAVPGGSPTLEFSYYRDMEVTSESPGFFYDSCRVANGNNNDILLWSDEDQIVNTPGGWQRVSVPMDEYIGSPLLAIRFSFESRGTENNDGEGWMIDDVVVRAVGSSVCDVTFENLVVTTDGGVGVSVMRAGHVKVFDGGTTSVSTTGAPAVVLADHTGEIYFDEISAFNSPSPGISIDDFDGFFGSSSGSVTTTAGDQPAVLVTHASNGDACLRITGMMLSGGTASDDVKLMKVGPGTLALSQGALLEFGSDNNGAVIGTEGNVGFGCSGP